MRHIHLLPFKHSAPLIPAFPRFSVCFPFPFFPSPLLFSEAGVQWLLNLLSVWFSCLSFPSRSFPFLLPPPLFFIQCIYLLTAFAYFNLLSTTPFPWISHLHVSPFWTLSIFLAHQAVMNSPSTFWFLALCCSISKPRVKTPFCAWLQQVLQND